MPKKNISKILIVLACTFILSACGKKKQETVVIPTPTPRLVEIELQNRPYISLIPRADGHELKLKIDQISSDIKAIEYELIYSATDENLEIEKGLSGTIDIDSTGIEKDLLLGTASCTNGCKYKYDSGVTGGSLNIIFTTQNNQIAMFETPFIILSTAQVKKDGISLSNFSLKATPSQNEFFILIKNYNNSYSVFSSGTGKGTVNTITDGYAALDETKISTDYTNE